MNPACPAHLVRGTGPRTIVFLHGIGGNAGGWLAELEHYADLGWRAVAWDMPGYGGTPPLAEPGWPGLAAALERLLDHLCADRAVLFGHSMGGMVAQEFAATRPERLLGLVLSATSPAFGRADGAWQQAFMRQRLEPLDAGRGMAELAPDLVAGMVGRNADPAGIATAVAGMREVPEASYRASVRLLTAFDRREALARIQVPTLVLAGEMDTAAPPEMMRHMAERIPGARYVRIADAGHLAHFEQPAKVRAALDDFLGHLEA